MCYSDQGKNTSSDGCFEKGKWYGREGPSGCQNLGISYRYEMTEQESVQGRHSGTLQRGGQV